MLTTEIKNKGPGDLLIIFTLKESPSFFGITPKDDVKPSRKVLRTGEFTKINLEAGYIIGIEEL